MIIYKTTNLINGKFYIGQDSNNDNSYLGSGLLIGKAIKKYGKQNFSKEILEYCETKEQLNEREKFWIDALSATTLGYNISFGGTGGDLFNCLSEDKKTENILKKSINAKIKNIMHEKNFFDCWVDRYGIDEAKIKLDEFKEKQSKLQQEKEKIKLEKIKEIYGDLVLSHFKTMTIDEIHKKFKGVISKKHIRFILKDSKINVLTRKGCNEAAENGMSKLSCEDVLNIISLKENKKRKEIAKIYNMSIGQISLVLNRKSYKKCHEK